MNRKFALIRKFFPDANPFPFVGGVTKVENVPTSVRFAVLDRISMTPLSVKKSNSDGTYKVYLARGAATMPVCVIAFDDTGKYNAQIADHITPATTNG